MKRKHCFQHIAAVMACLMLCVLCCSQAALAAGYRQLSAEELQTPCTLTLKYPLSGTQFRLYRVASVSKDVQFTPTEDFKGYPVFTPYADGSVKINELDSAGWTALANTLAGYVARDSAVLTPAAEITIGEDGKGDARGLPTGLYLVVGERGSEGNTTYTPAPFLAALPSWDVQTQSWASQVTADVKYETYTPPPGTNPDTLQRRVLKVWQDEGNENERPAEIVVDLLRDGTVYDTVTLTAENNWRYAWSNLGSQYQWQLVERELSEDYSVSVTLEGITFVVTNTYVEELDEEPPPRSDFPPDDEPEEPKDPEVPEEPNTPEKPETPEEPLEELEDPDVPTNRIDLPDPPEELPEVPEDIPDVPEDIPDVPENIPDVPEDVPEVPEDELELDEPDVPLSSLPQTGQFWWPVPLLAMAGVLLFAVGLARRIRSGKNED